MKVSHWFSEVLKLVVAQLTVDVKVITALGTASVDGPKVIDWLVTFTTGVSISGDAIGENRGATSLISGL